MRYNLRILSFTILAPAGLFGKFGFFHGASAASNLEKVKLHLRNDASLRLQVGWVNNEKQTVHSIGILEAFGSFSLKTFEDHEFELLELPNKQQGGKCNVTETGLPVTEALQKKEGCAVKRFQVEEKGNQYLLITDDMMIRNDELMSSLNSFRLRDMSQNVGLCRVEAKRRLLKAKTGGFTSRDTTDRILRQLEFCISLGVAPSLKSSHDQVGFEAQVRREVSRSIEEYTCGSDLNDSTPDVDLRQWTSGKDKITRTVHVKFERPATRIHVVEDFASPRECAAMEERVAGKLGRATTADGKGGFQLNENRKAQQAYIYPNWTQEDSEDPILQINRRIFEYTNEVLGLNISVAGQEPLMSIQYFGRGYNDTSPDRYNSHCDGICEGGPHRYAGRMATMVIYCTVPERGGMTNFNNAGVTIKPVTGSAIFFSYIDPLTNITDTGFSQHSGCPVYEGRKAIITQWIRLGVTKELTADHYNSLDVLESEQD